MELISLEMAFVHFLTLKFGTVIFFPFVVEITGGGISEELKTEIGDALRRNNGWAYF